MNTHRAISHPLGVIKDSYTVVVVGSGYGGGVAASRMARAGQTVCLLERGREILPGFYPKTLQEVKDETQVESKVGHSGDPTAMLDLRLNDDVNVVLGCGLGGTSLINANVSLEMKTDLFDQKWSNGKEKDSFYMWPKVYRKNPTILDPYYSKARSMLDPVAYPDDYPDLKKLETLQMSAKEMGATDHFYRPPLNVTFKKRVNQFGVPQDACTNCGDCCTGCNYGAKNTTLMNYLPDAANHGAEIFTEASVRYLEKVEDGWIVHIAAPGDDTRDVCTVKAEVVILGAGTLGSTEILKRSERKGLSLSPALGERFSGNGDILGFAYNSFWKKNFQNEQVPIYGVGQGDNDIPKSKMPGPTITGIIDMRTGKDVKDRFVIEEGVIPGPTASLLASTFFFADAEFGNMMQYGPKEAAERLMQAKTLGEAIEGGGDSTKLAYEGPVARTQTYLIMSHDDAIGEMKLENDRLRVDWRGAGDDHAIVHGNKMMKEAAEGIEAQFIPNLMWMEQMGRKIVTVHPIGGCCMADNIDKGVVNADCQVFSGREGESVHDGLYVTDGAVIPGALGVNPLFTISAIAERAVHRLAEARDWTIDYSFGTIKSEVFHPEVLAAAAQSSDEKLTEWAARPKHRGLLYWLKKIRSGIIGWFKDMLMVIIRFIAKYFANSVSPGLTFTETMHGYYSDWNAREVLRREQISNLYKLAAAEGKAEGKGKGKGKGKWSSDKNQMHFKLTISSDDIYHMINEDPKHISGITGKVYCEQLSEHPLDVRDGEFCLLAVDENQVETFVMTYNFVMHKSDETALFFRGTKYLKKVGDSIPWQDLTTLYVDIYDGNEANEKRHRGRALLTLGMEDLIPQLETFEFPQSNKFVNRHPWLKSTFEWIFVEQYASFFSHSIMKVYGGLLADLSNFAWIEEKKRTRRPLTCPHPIVHHIRATDGRKIRLLRYQNEGGNAVVLAPGFSVAARSFAADTIDKNIVESLYEEGYDVWLFDYRASPDSGSSTKSFTVDDIAVHDWPAAVSFIRKTSKCTSLQGVVHCVGSMSLLMALLRGMEGIDSLIASQLTLHPMTSWLNDVKADIGLADMIRHTKISKLHMNFTKKFNMRSSNRTQDKVIDAVMYQIPVPEGEECNNPLCRRVFGIFGPSWRHDNLNHETHIALREWFGSLSTKPFEQLSIIIDGQKTVDAKGRDVYLPNVDRLKLPISFIAGAENQIFFSETSKRTYDWLCEHNGDEFYNRKVFQGYAHMDFWIGKNASRDITPWVLCELKALRGEVSQGDCDELVPPS